MNQKTSRLLSRYARDTNQTAKDLKRWWESLPRNQRGQERARIKAAMQK